ncbi:MAG: triose-phosphate isomerase [Chloroflexi bacterium]|nr:triose-phosphate isomerase [Chloroflexota bacterium]
MTISMVVGNWKMNTTLVEAEALAAGIAERIDDGYSPYDAGVEVVVCPPFISLSAVQAALRNSNISIGAQNVYHAASGAYTGEVSAGMLIDICKYAIVGHSERRSLFGETDEAVNLKAKAALDAGITPILCVGESLEERESGNAKSVVERQVRAGLDGVDLGGVVVAYEPVWAIGMGQSASPEIAQSMMAHIRQTLAALGGTDAADTVPLLYGGSVNAGNIAGYIAQPDVSGALVGGASLDAESFTDIVSVMGGA